MEGGLTECLLMDGENINAVSDDGCTTGDYAENHWIVHFKMWILLFVFHI